MINPQLAPAIYIDSQSSLDDLVIQLMDEPLIALDTESNSLYAYEEKVCLIQLSTRMMDYIIDPLMVDVQALGRLIADPKIEKVFHAAEYDVGCLKRDYAFEFYNLFDTMWASRVIGHKAFGLGSLLEHYFGVELDKRHQRDNWGRRPLPQDSLIYAQMDTHFLPVLRDMLYTELEEQGHLEEADEIFTDVCHAPAMERSHYEPDAFWYIGNPHDLNRKQLAILRELYDLRDELAREQDLPPFKVFGNKTLIAIAEREPHYEGELYDLYGMSSWKVREYGKQLIDAVAVGRHRLLPHQPRHVPPDPVVADRFTALNNWRRARARKRGVGVDVIISKHVLWDIARIMPKDLDEMSEVPGLGPWRLKAYGQELLNLLHRHNHNGTH